MVDRARERIRVGDVFEVVLSRTFHAPYDAAPSQLYERMTRINPSPYEFLIQLGDEQLVGTSPEMFVRVEDRRVESCPISGTARRGADAMEDAARLKALINSEKDEVELTMCTDVDRNDKARVCEPGSVRLLARRQIETYAGLFHTVDHVEGRLRDGFDGIDAFLSHMWAVTLTGAPKRMAAGIVEAQETSARGWYGGAVGALLFNGDVNTGITIRTIHLRAGMARYRVGATIVWDSTGPEEERETRLKSTTLFRALAPDTPRGPAGRRTQRGPDRQRGFLRPHPRRLFPPDRRRRAHLPPWPRACGNRRAAPRPGRAFAGSSPAGGFRRSRTRAWLGRARPAAVRRLPRSAGHGRGLRRRSGRADRAASRQDLDHRA
jgi:anthranilate synthase